MIGKLWPDSNCWCWGASCLSHAIWMRWSFTRPRASQKASAGFRSTPSQVILYIYICACICIWKHKSCSPTSCEAIHNMNLGLTPHGAFCHQICVKYDGYPNIPNCPAASIKEVYWCLFLYHYHLEKSATSIQYQVRFGSTTNYRASGDYASSENFDIGASSLQHVCICVWVAFISLTFIDVPMDFHELSIPNDLDDDSRLGYALQLRPSKDNLWTHRPEQAAASGKPWGPHQNPGSNCCWSGEYLLI